MWRSIVTLLTIAVMTAVPAAALNSGDTIVVPAAGRIVTATNPFVTDLFIMNTGTSTVSVTVSWLVRNQPNPSPTMSFSLTLLPGETAPLDDVILNDFGMTTGDGAFLIEATGDVIANCRIYADTPSGTNGQGFEGVPLWAFTQAGQTLDAVGLTQNADFRSNVYAIAGPDGATVDLSLLDPSGSEIASTTLTLGAYQPYLRRVNQTFSGVANFANATLHGEVTAGAAVVGGSKADNTTNDPTTLEPSLPFGGPIDGTYHFAITDSAGFATGGNLVIQDGLVAAINGTYSNYDKLDGGAPACEVVFLWGLGLNDLGPTPVEDFLPANGGVVFEDSYTQDGSGVMEWTVEFEIDNNMSLVGTIAAEGSDFTLPDETGCNGSFPEMNLDGGKAN